jgi:hypothetical protein
MAMLFGLCDNRRRKVEGHAPFLLTTSIGALLQRQGPFRLQWELFCVFKSRFSEMKDGLVKNN